MISINRNLYKSINIYINNFTKTSVMNSLAKQRFAQSKNISHILKTYEHIKSKEQQSANIQQSNIQKYEQNNIANQNLMSIRCRGCNSHLQSTDKNKYGYIDQKVLNQAVQHNIRNINKVYEDKVRSKDSKILDFMHEVQKQSGIKIFNSQTGAIQNLDNLEVLMRLEQKIDRYEELEQLAKKSKRDRKDVLCFRCFSLKHHNRLPREYDNNQGFTTDSREFILNKIFNRHKNNQKISVHFFLVIDCFDILGTLPEDLVHRLLSEKLTFSIIVNKTDLIHKKYLDEQAVHKAVKQALKKAIKTYIKKNRQSISGNQQQQLNKLFENISTFYLSSVSYDGYKKLKKFVSQTKGNLQLVGLPNTGKTTIINALSKSLKSTSKVPGTTIKITEHEYGRGSNRKIYDMPGLFYPHLMYNLITKPSIMSMLTWDKKITPGIFTHFVFIYGGKIQIQGARIIVFGLGGACSSNNRWFVANVSEFWKGLPALNQLKVKKYEHNLEFVNGATQDLQIAGYGFIGFQLCQPQIKKCTRKVTFYLPESVGFSFRSSILSKDKTVYHNKSAFTKQFMLERLHERPIKQKKNKKKKQSFDMKTLKKNLLKEKQINPSQELLLSMDNVQMNDEDQFDDDEEEQTELQ